MRGCSSQVSGADLSACCPQEVWRDIQGSTGRLSDHSQPNQADSAAAAAAPRGHPTAGLRRQAVPESERGAEESRATELRAAELTDGMDRLSVHRWHVMIEDMTVSQKQS